MVAILSLCVHTGHMTREWKLSLPTLSTPRLATSILNRLCVEHDVTVGDMCA